MDLGLAGIAIALLTIEIAFYFWHEPQIGHLEKARLEMLRRRIDHLFGGPADHSECRQQVFRYLATALEHDRLLLMSVGKLTPHHRIFFILIASLCVSFVHTASVAWWNPLLFDGFWIFHWTIRLSTVLTLFCIGLWTIAIYNGVVEFHYLQKIKRAFDSPPVAN